MKSINIRLRCKTVHCSTTELVLEFSNGIIYILLPLDTMSTCPANIEFAWKGHAQSIKLNFPGPLIVMS